MTRTSRLLRFFVIYIFFILSLFSFRILYSFIVYPDNPSERSSSVSDQGNSRSGFEMNRKNYASDKKIKEPNLPGGQGKFDQKYEKVGALSSETGDFENDERKTRDLIATYKALIQQEENSGLNGNRILRMGIGVSPDSFDNFLADIKKIASTTSIHIQKTDKTNEYRDLNAQKTSLEKTRAALIALKSKGGKIQELIDLENKILETEEKIQNLGVRLGEYDEENEFCTVKFTLIENHKRKQTGLMRSIMIRLNLSFIWTVKWGLLATFLFSLSVSGLWFMILILDKLKVLQPLIKGILQTIHTGGDRKRS